MNEVSYQHPNFPNFSEPESFIVSAISQSNVMSRNEPKSRASYISRHTDNTQKTDKGCKKKAKPKKEAIDDFRILRCRNLPKHFNQNMAFNLFCQYGEILSIKLIEDEDEKDSRVVYIEYGSSEGTKNGRKYLQGTTVGNQDLMIDLTKYDDMSEIESFEINFKGDVHIYTLDSHLQRNFKLNSKLSYPTQFLKVSNLDKSNFIKFTRIMAEK